MKFRTSLAPIMAALIIAAHAIEQGHPVAETHPVPPLYKFACALVFDFVTLFFPSFIGALAMEVHEKADATDITREWVSTGCLISLVFVVAAAVARVVARPLGISPQMHLAGEGVGFAVFMLTLFFAGEDGADTGDATMGVMMAIFVFISLASDYLGSPASRPPPPPAVAAAAPAPAGTHHE